MNIKIPEEVKFIIDTLENNGYEAYAVGGCVRDNILGAEPKDWDICTSAMPDQTMKCFAGCHIIETGLKHGTITLMLNHKPFEITTYRIDGVYTDNRRPDKVEFVNDLKADLSRRDFTINAIAYNPEKGLADLFDGVNDLKNGIIKCVGDANKRFREDALRIMRAMRFAAVLGFKIDGGTSKAMLYNKNLLHNIAAERIAAELNKMIIGKNIREILLRHAPVITEIIPEIHAADFMNIDSVPPDVILRLAVLFCNLGEDTARKILRRLKYDNNTVQAVTQLILYRDADIQPHSKNIKRWLNKIGEERFRQLLEVKKAGDKSQEKLNMLDNIEFLLNEIISQKQCFSLKDLAVKGGDLIALGIPAGSEIGAILNQLLYMVIDEQIENDKAKLLNAAEKLLWE